MSRKYDPEKGGAENFPTISDLNSDTTKQHIAAGDRLAKKRHENLKQRGYTGWAYDPQAVQDYQQQERAHKGNSGL
jgi:hypothetical protein